MLIFWRQTQWSFQKFITTARLPSEIFALCVPMLIHTSRRGLRIPQDAASQNLCNGCGNAEVFRHKYNLFAIFLPNNFKINLSWNMSAYRLKSIIEDLARLGQLATKSIKIRGRKGGFLSGLKMFLSTSKSLWRIAKSFCQFQLYPEEFNQLLSRLPFKILFVWTSQQIFYKH